MITQKVRATRPPFSPPARPPHHHHFTFTSIQWFLTPSPYHPPSSSTAASPPILAPRIAITSSPPRHHTLYEILFISNLIFKNETSTSPLPRVRPYYALFPVHKFYLPCTPSLPRNFLYGTHAKPFRSIHLNPLIHMYTPHIHIHSTLSCKLECISFHLETSAKFKTNLHQKPFLAILDTSCILIAPRRKLSNVFFLYNATACIYRKQISSSRSPRAIQLCDVFYFSLH